MFPHSLASNFRPLCATATTLAVAPSSFAQQLGQAWGAASFFKSCAQKYAINTQETGRRPKIFEKRFTNFMLIKFIAAAGKKKVLLTHTYTAYLS